LIGIVFEEFSKCIGIRMLSSIGVVSVMDAVAADVVLARN